MKSGGYRIHLKPKPVSKEDLEESNEVKKEKDEESVCQYNMWTFLATKSNQTHTFHPYMQNRHSLYKTDS